MITSRQFMSSVRLALSFFALGAVWSTQAATTNVAVAQAGATFSPASVSINVNDSVTWNWVGSFHSSTSASALWDSGIQNAGFTFTFTFTNAADYPYFCTPHQFIGMTGLVHVAGAALPRPAVTITNPPNNAIFSEPWSGVIQATASETGGSITNVQFMLDATILGDVATPPYSIGVTNVAAGPHTLGATATDASGTSTNATIAISVVTPVPVILSDPHFISPTQFRFTYSANPGLRYVIERSADLSSFTPVATNTAAGSSVPVTDSVPFDGQNFYRVARLPNP
jgi:plastocyanin